MHRGWVKLWRKWRDHEVARDPNASHLLNHLLCAARLTTFENRRYGYTVERGECDLTQEQLAELSGLTRKQIREAMTRLLRYQTIEIRPLGGQGRGQRRNIIKLVNFEKYNVTPSEGADKGADKTANEGPTNGQGRASLEEVKNVENEKNTTSASDKPKRPVREKVNPTTAVIPDDLGKYEDAIRQFVAWRDETLRKPVYAGSWDKFLDGCRKLGVQLQDAIDQSMANGWQGLFAPKRGAFVQQEDKSW